MCYLLSTYYVACTLLGAPVTQFSQLPLKVEIIPILQMRELRRKEIKTLPKVRWLAWGIP